MTNETKANPGAQTTAHQNHAKAAEHCDAASASHKQAAKHAESGDTKQAGQHAAAAEGHMTHAIEHSAIACKKSAEAATNAK